MKKPLTAIIVGCGHRARIYADVAKIFPSELKIVAIVDPSDNVLQLTGERYNVPKNQWYHSINEVLAKGKIADCVINGTMDQIHIETSIPFLEQGYDMLLEKPITNNAKDLLHLRDVAKKNNRKLMICHVLRYADFYRTAKEIVLSGEIGDVVHIETNERVGVGHNCISFIRGKWNNEKECGSSMLLAKCCHDIDLICWLNNATTPRFVSSFGSRSFITKENAPKESGTRCLVDCPLLETCQYSAKRLHIDSNYLSAYPWQCTGKEANQLTKEEKIESLKTNNPNGLCAWKVNADVVDHQVVSIEFENGSTAIHSMLCSSQRAGRSLYIMGTKGEIEGWGGDGKLVVRTYDPDLQYLDKGKERVIDFNNSDQSEKGGHFGGDYNLSVDFVKYFSGEKPSVSCTSINDSINGHLVVYAADKARITHKVIDMRKEY